MGKHKKQSTRAYTTRAYISERNSQLFFARHIHRVLGELCEEIRKLEPRVFSRFENAELEYVRTFKIEAAITEFRHIIMGMEIDIKASEMRSAMRADRKASKMEENNG